VAQEVRRNEIIKAGKPHRAVEGPADLSHAISVPGDDEEPHAVGFLPAAKVDL
jgi:hypothetical protein